MNPDNRKNSKARTLVFPRACALAIYVYVKYIHTTTAPFSGFLFKGPHPPAPRCGDSDQGIYVGEWMVPRCYGIEGFEKGLHTTKNRTRLGVFDIFEKTGGVSKLPHSYFPYVGVPR